MNDIGLTLMRPDLAHAGIKAEAAFNRQEALARVDGDEEFLRELAGIFTQECPRWLADIKTAIDHGGSTVVMRLAHTLKGAASVFFPPATIAAAQRLETAAAADSLPQMTIAYQDLVSAVESLLKELEHFSAVSGHRPQ